MFREYWGYIGVTLGFYWGSIGVTLGFYRGSSGDNGKEHGNYYIMTGYISAVLG